LYGSPERLRIVPSFAPSIHSAQASRSLVGFEARSPPLASWVLASSRQVFASARLTKVFLIFLPSRLLNTLAS
jgi:hypothetical protein